MKLIFAAGALSGTNLAAYMALAVSVLGPLIALVQAWSSRRTRRERDAANLKVVSEAGSISTGTPLEWRATDHAALLDERAYSEKTRNQLIVAEAEVRTLRDSVAECDRRMDAMQEDIRQLRVSIAACPGGPPCPLRPAAMPPPPSAPPPG